MDKLEIKKRAYEIFRDKCMKMVECKFLLAQPSIANVLKCIIASPELYQFTKDCVNNIELDAELSKATVDQESRAGIVLPKSKRVLIALVTYMLNEFDNNGIDLMEFISFYYNPDTTIGYHAFCREVILPYADAFKELFLSDGELSEDNENDKSLFNPSVTEQASDIIGEVMNKIQEDNSILEQEREDLLMLTEGMLIALNDLNARVIKSLWIGMKYAFAKNRKIQKTLKDLEKLFIRYSIL